MSRFEFFRAVLPALSPAQEANLEAWAVKHLLRWTKQECSQEKLLIGQLRLPVSTIGAAQSKLNAAFRSWGIEPSCRRSWLMPLESSKFEQLHAKLLVIAEEVADVRVNLPEALRAAGVSDPKTLLRKRGYPVQTTEVPLAEAIRFLRSSPGDNAKFTAERLRVADYLEETRGDLPETRAEPTSAERNPQAAAELCRLLQIERVHNVRCTGEGRNRLFSLIDVAVLVSGKEARHAADDVQLVLNLYNEVSETVGDFKFEGQGQRDTPVGDLKTTLLVLLRLRSGVAQKITANVPQSQN